MLIQHVSPFLIIHTIQDMTDSKSTPNMGPLPHSKGVPNLMMDPESNSHATPHRNRRGRDGEDEAENGGGTPGRRFNGISLIPQVQVK